MISNGNGSNAQRNDAQWHIYYSNPKPNGGSFLLKNRIPLLNIGQIQEIILTPKHILTITIL
ncbi:hypothetical protein [Flavobacterium piscinae]|uniref:hypothetical protein n=1 Tax=Flavobacterium piscinae TaxID=2506424 RepID=UPI002AAC446A|nr:hypothetical protein [Flavobacterium piscinae]